MDNLTPKQEKFCQECLITNRTEAYRRCYNTEGKPPSYIKQKAYDLFHKPHVKTRFDELQKELAKRSEWTREKSIMKLTETLDKTDRANEIVAIIKELNTMHGYNIPAKDVQALIANFTMNLK